MKTCALVIGHKKTSPGASNATSGVTEFDFNDALARDIEKHVEDVTVQRIYRRTYNLLPADINELAPDFIISLHCNAYNTEVSGTEMLYYHKSSQGKLMAKILQNKVLGALGLNDRGIRAKGAEDRGGYLLKNTAAPCVIAEPFFIDNDSDLVKANSAHDALVAAYAEGICEIARQI